MKLKAICNGKADTYLAPGPGHQRNLVYGRPDMWHSAPFSKRCMRTYGLGPRHVSQTMGKSARSTLSSCSSLAAMQASTGGTNDCSLSPADLKLPSNAFLLNCSYVSSNVAMKHTPLKATRI